MPLYEYKCLSCEKICEVMQKFSDAPLESCPDCQGSVTKLVSLGSFSLKGSGWYTTDYKRAPAPVAPVASPSVPTPTPVVSGAVSPIAPVASQPVSSTATKPTETK